MRNRFILQKLCSFTIKEATIILTIDFTKLSNYDHFIKLYKKDIVQFVREQYPNFDIDFSSIYQTVNYKFDRPKKSITFICPIKSRYIDVNKLKKQELLEFAVIKDISVSSRMLKSEILEKIKSQLD